MDEWSAKDSAPQSGRRRRYDAVTVTLAVLLVLMSAVTGGALAAALHADTPTVPAPRAAGGANGQPPLANNARPGTSNGQSAGSSPSSGQSDDGTGPTADPTAIGRNVAPGIVNIDTWIGYQQARAAGTGMVLTPTGEVLTNNHVIKGATRIRATIVGTGKAYDAHVVGYDRSHDVAVLQLVGASGLPTVSLSKAPVSVGQPVVAVGNAGGKGGEPTYAGGVITALDRSITAGDQSDGTSERLTDLIETDADVVPGDSGGALANADGDVIGMTTAASDDFRFTAGGRGYAIPIEDALGIARQIRQGVSSTTVHIGPTAMLGVEVQTAGNPASSYRFGQSGGGALVAGVVDGGPAESAGLTAGDAITGIDGRQVTSAGDLSDLMIAARPGSTVIVDYLDDADAQQHIAHVRLATGPPQ